MSLEVTLFDKKSLQKLYTEFMTKIDNGTIPDVESLATEIDKLKLYPKNATELKLINSFQLDLLKSINAKLLDYTKKEFNTTYKDQISMELNELYKSGHYEDFYIKLIGINNNIVPRDKETETYKLFNLDMMEKVVIIPEELKYEEYEKIYDNITEPSKLFEKFADDIKNETDEKLRELFVKRLKDLVAIHEKKKKFRINYQIFC